MGMLRALWRAVAAISVSAWYLLGLWVRSAFKGPDMDHGMQIRQRWSAACVKILGIKVLLQEPPPTDGGYLFVGNHRSYADINIVLEHVIASIIAKAEVANIPIIGPGAKQTFTVMVKREDKDSRQKTREAMEVILSKGYSIVVYAEGTTYEGPGILPFRQGSFKAAETGKFTVVPFALEFEHPEDAWVGDEGLGAHFFRTFTRPTSRVALSFGKPMLVADWQIAHDVCERWVREETMKLRELFNDKLI